VPDKPGHTGPPLQIAVVGSGPSGFYAAESLLKSGAPVRVCMLERLPVPYGLVRSGVAPDHAKLKQVIDVYARIAEMPGYEYYGNVRVGHDVSIDELREAFHAVILACGAESDKSLGIDGESLPGSHTATEFVGWYNGHPDFRDRLFDLSHERAVIIGQGNVAADVARILAKSPAELEHTDIAEHALKALRTSRISEIHVIGRRGPAQAKFTSKELKEFGELEACDAALDPAELALNEASRAELTDPGNAGAKRVFEIFSGFAARSAGNAPRRVVFTFLKSPVRIEGDGRVRRIVLEHNSLSGAPMNQSARGTGTFVSIDTGLVFRSIGYRGVPMPGVPFDSRSGTIPHADGRVVADGRPVPQIYVAGWIKRGPTGIIGTNRADSVATVASLVTDLPKLSAAGRKSGFESLCSILKGRHVRPVNFADWKRIDAAEVARGAKCGKPREKYTCVSDMLAVLEPD
jgi:ferredoxin--NADP+ reductase